MLGLWSRQHTLWRKALRLMVGKFNLGVGESWKAQMVFPDPGSPQAWDCIGVHPKGHAVFFQVFQCLLTKRKCGDFEVLGALGSPKTTGE